MKRTKAQKWRLAGGGFFYATINGKKRIIKPGQIFEARSEEIPEGFRDVIFPVSEDKEALIPSPIQPKEEPKEVEPIPAEEAPEPKYFIEKRAAGYFNVVDVNGKVMNEKALRKDAADELLASLK